MVAMICDEHIHTLTRYDVWRVSSVWGGGMVCFYGFSLDPSGAQDLDFNQHLL